MKKRIWELDVFRGICILGVILVHFLFDIFTQYHLQSDLFDFIAHWGGIVFLVLSGICVTLGSHAIRRGLIVLGCGLGVTLVTYCAAQLDIMAESLIVWFGVLHCLGICMLLWPLCRRLPAWVLGLLGGAIVFAGLFFDLRADHPWLVPFGFIYPGFTSGDYFPLLPDFGFFLLGALLGKTLYRKKQTLFPRVNPQNCVLRFFSFCGRQSLPIYLIHQPILFVLIWLWTQVF